MINKKLYQMIDDVTDSQDQLNEALANAENAIKPLAVFVGKVTIWQRFKWFLMGV